MPVPKYFSAKSILPENWSVITTEYFIISIPRANTMGERKNLIFVYIKPPENAEGIFGERGNIPNEAEYKIIRHILRNFIRSGVRND